MFRKFSQLRWFVLMTALVMGIALVGCTRAISENPSVQPGRFTDSQPVVLTCSSASYHTYSGIVAGKPGRTICNEAKSPDGRTALVRLRDTREGEKVNCTEKEGKVTCPDVPLAAYNIPRPGVAAGAPGFVFPPIPPAVTSSPLVRP
ncbi:MAG TPA: hypothetical protein VI542_14975 [Candidatus Tectomicrobia bacterium]